jgi:NO-binding membrane sensor protein with MHYT domain
MSCMGAFLGLRCASRARAYRGWPRARWLLLAGVSIGTTGIWVMHFIAMLGFTIPGQTILYSVPITLLSMLIAVALVCAGLLIVGFGGDRRYALLLAGLITGLGVASMHYTGMAAMQMQGRIGYNLGLVAVSVVIALVAASAVLWATTRVRGTWATLAASLIAGVAVSGMHYTGMAAMRMYPATMVMGTGGATAGSFLLPLVLGISITAFILIATISLSPNEDEIRHDADLQERIGKLGALGRSAFRPA